MERNPTHPPPKHTGVRSVLFFALVRSLQYQEGKLILDACAYWKAQICVCCLHREAFKWAVRGSLQPLGGLLALLILKRIMQTEGEYRMME